MSGIAVNLINVFFQVAGRVSTVEVQSIGISQIFPKQCRVDIDVVVTCLSVDGQSF